MKQINEVDAEGLYIGPVIASDEQIARHLNQDDEFTLGMVVIAPISEGFYHPKWSGTEWIEGLGQEQIDAMKNVPVTPTEMDVLKEQNAELNLQIIDIWETLIIGGVV